MRFTPCQFGVALLALVLGPVLGVGGSAHAGYLVKRPLERFAVTGTDAESGMADAESDPSKEPLPATPGPTTHLRESYHLWWMGLGNSGAGSNPVSTSAGSGVSVLHANVFSQVNLPPLQVVGWLYFGEVHYRPPPFASRLFRPPRSV